VIGNTLPLTRGAVTAKNTPDRSEDLSILNWNLLLLQYASQNVMSPFYMIASSEKFHSYHVLSTCRLLSLELEPIHHLVENNITEILVMIATFAIRQSNRAKTMKRLGLAASSA